MNDTISIIIPVYNVEKYISKCIESVLKQSLENIEIIIVDDGSTDTSGAICDKYAQLDSRIKVIHEKNGGLSKARNVGIDISTGDYLAFVDGDDIVHPCMYEILFRLMREKSTDIAVCAYKRFIDEERWEDEYSHNTRVYNNTSALKNIDIIKVVAWNKLYKRAIFNDIRYPVGKVYEDEYVIHQILYECNGIAYTEAELYGYRVRNGSITMIDISKKNVLDAEHAFRDRINFTYQKKWKKAQKCALNRYYEYASENYFFLEKNRIDDYLALREFLLEGARKMMHSKREGSFKYRIFTISPKLYAMIYKRDAYCEKN